MAYLSCEDRLYSPWCHALARVWPPLALVVSAGLRLTQQWLLRLGQIFLFGGDDLFQSFSRMLHH
jgi:hypothetical protein